MESVEYSRLRAFEEGYWWYRAQRQNLVVALRDLGLSPGSRILDAGCGTGRNLIELAETMSVRVYGFDHSADAAALWNGERGVHRCLASINAIPHPDGFFHAVCSVDVLGCRGVDIERAMLEMARVLRPGGALVLLVPAYQWLLSAHDAAVHSVHRFTRAELRNLARRAALTVTRLTHRFATFFPAIAAARLLSKGTDACSNTSDLRALPPWLNTGLGKLARAEHALLHRVNVPFGTTILLVARKETA